MGEALRLSKGEGTGLAIRRGGGSKEFGALSSPSLRPDMRRLARGRREEDVVVEVVRPLLLGFVDIAVEAVGRGGRHQHSDGLRLGCRAFRTVSCCLFSRLS